MTEQCQPARAAILLGVLGLSTGCISSQDLAISEANEVPDEQTAVSQGAVENHSMALASDATWDVYRTRGLEKKAYLGKAQLVCSSQATPAGCPAGAVDYGFTDGVWTAHIDACDGIARWIWAPGITGASAPSDWAEYYFAKHVSVPGRPTSAQIHVAVDDVAEVIINGAAIGIIGSATDFGVAWAGQSKPTVIDITHALGTGANTIAIRAANGTGAYASCTNCTYQQNPAGVVFCVDIRY